MRGFSSISPLLSNRPPKLMSNLLLIDMASAQLLLPTIQPSTQVHVQSAICWHDFHPTSPPISTNTHVINSPNLGLLFLLIFRHYCSYLIRMQMLFMLITSQQYLSYKGWSYLIKKGKFIQMLAGYHIF